MMEERGRKVVQLVSSPSAEAGGESVYDEREYLRATGRGKKSGTSFSLKKRRSTKKPLDESTLAEIRKKAKEAVDFSDKREQLMERQKCLAESERLLKIQSPLIRRVKIHAFVADSMKELENLRRSDFACGAVAVISILFAILQEELSFREDWALEDPERNVYESSASVVMLQFFCSACTLLLFAGVWWRYNIQVQLKRVKREAVIEDNVLSMGYLPYLLFEYLVILPHPIPFLTNFTYEGRTVFGDPYYFTWSTFLTPLSLFRLYLVLRVYVHLNPSTASPSRYAHEWWHTEPDVLFAVKAALKEYPMVILTFQYVIFGLVFGYAIMVLDRSAREGQNFGFGQALWLTIVTMTTVGYGDLYPLTVGSRTAAVLSCYAGVYTLSLVIVALTDVLAFTDRERRSYTLYQTDSYMNSKRKAAARYILTYWRLWKLRQRGTAGGGAGSSHNDAERERGEGPEGSAATRFSEAARHWRNVVRRSDKVPTNSTDIILNDMIRMIRGFDKELSLHIGGLVHRIDEIRQVPSSLDAYLEDVFGMLYDEMNRLAGNADGNGKRLPRAFQKNPHSRMFFSEKLRAAQTVPGMARRLADLVRGLPARVVRKACPECEPEETRMVGEKLEAALRIIVGLWDLERAPRAGGGGGHGSTLDRELIVPPDVLRHMILAFLEGVRGKRRSREDSSSTAGGAGALSRGSSLANLGGGSSSPFRKSKSVVIDEQKNEVRSFSKGEIGMHYAPEDRASFFDIWAPRGAGGVGDSDGTLANLTGSENLPDLPPAEGNERERKGGQRRPRVSRMIYFEDEPPLPVRDEAGVELEDQTPILQGETAGPTSAPHPSAFEPVEQPRLGSTAPSGGRFDRGDSGDYIGDESQQPDGDREGGYHEERERGRERGSVLLDDEGAEEDEGHRHPSGWNATQLPPAPNPAQERPERDREEARDRDREGNRDGDWLTAPAGGSGAPGGGGTDWPSQGNYPSERETAGGLGQGGEGGQAEREPEGWGDGHVEAPVAGGGEGGGEAEEQGEANAEDQGGGGEVERELYYTEDGYAYYYDMDGNAYWYEEG